MANFKRYGTVLVLVMLVFAFPAWVQGITLPTQGTCKPEYGAYVCNYAAFQFVKMQWNKPLFSIDFNHQCKVVFRDEYLPGWGGGGGPFKIVYIHGEYRENNGWTREKIIHEGAVIIEVTLTCAKNPWVFGYEAAGCGAPTIKNTVMFCGGPVPLDGPFPLSVRYLPNDLLTFLQEWDDNKDKTDPVADWDPYAAPPSYSILKITSPTSGASIGEHAASFTLSLQNLPSVPPGGVSKKVLMRWQRAQEVPEWDGDIHVAPGTYDWVTFTGPPDAWSKNFPLTVAVEPGYFAGKPGHYRVQVKLAYETWWSDWRSFWIGQPTVDAKKLSKTPAMVAVKKNALSAKIPKGSVKSQVTKGQATPAPIVVKQAGVVVQGISYTPAPLTPGNTVKLIITFKNNGQADSSAALKYSLTCTVKSGGPACLVPNTTRPINKSIPAGQTYNITLIATDPAVAGTYEVTVKPEGGTAASGKTITIDVKLKIKPTKGMVAPTKAK
ncbi:MAG: hypothetical protein MUO24_04385 [Desulfobacterales bacterium]|nr:hypothetical protein [Desulfobacterales bacterium]